MDIARKYKTCSGQYPTLRKKHVTTRSNAPVPTNHKGHENCAHLPLNLPRQ